MNSLFSSKFVQLIKTFDKVELKAFEIWLKSPWCTSNKNLYKLFNGLKKYYPAFENKKFNKEKLFYQILPNGKYSDRRMNNLLSEAFLSAEQFLTFQKLKRDHALQKDLLTQDYLDRSLDSWFFKYTNQEIERLESIPVKDWEDHLKLLSYHRRTYHHPDASIRMQPGNRNIIRINEETDLVYLLEKAAVINEKIFRTRILKNENHNISEELKKWYSVAENIDHPAIDMYKLRFEYQEDNMLEKYQVLKTKFFSEFRQLNKEDQKTHLFSLLNDTFKLIKAGDLGFGESLALYKMGLKNELLFVKNKLTYNTFTSIVLSANRNKEFEFTRSFIKNYAHYLDKEVESDAITWAKAHTAYQENSLQEALNLLINHQFKLLYFRLGGRILTTQVYFDLFIENDSYQSYLFNYFDSFEKWIQREKFRSNIIKKSYLKFIQICRGLAKYHIDVAPEKNKKENLFEDIKNVQAINWLINRKEKVLTMNKKY